MFSIGLKSKSSNPQKENEALRAGIRWKMFSIQFGISIHGGIGVGIK
jgi:hypothetical protein